ncbi:unnamed protein product [Bursaphelenchus okinawaensis]|uniref:Uncharacterized protein n=1 Tax=Bursaphelenchus okinawaensis TaxID=465554 RepID=A0A811JUC5_9BILA|nr:unnamed protein product [Bursaphelenchus okinawaensis]CAG9083440.1 unnamed protein product [Bursaphelenchus okinawaensis]
MHDITIESLAKKQGNEVGPASLPPEQDQTTNKEVDHQKTPDKKREAALLSSERLLNEIREYDFNYRLYFILLTAEFLVVTVLVILGFVLLGLYTEWKFQ